MEVRIGITNAREVIVEMADDTTTDSVKTTISDAVASGAGFVWLTDKKGREVGFPVAQLAFVEVGVPGDDQRIGFG